MKRRFISGFLAALMMFGQLAWTGAAAASDEAGTPSPSAAAVVSPTVTPEPTATATPTGSATATPTATAAVEPTATPGSTVTPDSTSAPSATVEPSVAAPAATGTASPSPAVSPTNGAHKVQDTDTATGPGGCGGVVPGWVFDTVQNEWVAADKPSFSCDMASGYYLSPKYFYDKRSGWYEIMPAAEAAANPDLMTSPNVVHTVLGDLVVGSKDYEVAKALGLLDSGGGSGILAPAGSASVNGTGTGSDNQIAANSGGQSWFDLTNLVNVINTLQSNATSGNAAVGSNTTVGNVGTGAASVVANLINLLASAWSWSSGNLNFFMQNIIAPLTGDISLNPTVTTTAGGGGLGGNSAAINGTGTDSNNTIDINDPNNLNVKAQNTGNIVNNVDLNAVSGSASAGSNTQVGNVASGSAMAQVNIINLINSFITSGSSFFGILNIIGNLNGDILFPTGFLNGLLPAGAAAPSNTTATIGATGADSNNQLGVDNSKSATLNSTSNNSINNNILTNAGSGTASAGSNTTVGSVGSGAASTNQSLFNMANSSIFGDNAVLVMVNVLGHWVGKIMSLPGTGNSQAALLTGNAQVDTNAPSTALSATNTGADSNNQANIDNSNTAKINQQSTGTITNNVKVNAQSGDASADKNTKVGEVSTGTAQANSSVANLFNTVLNVKHWFGVLVINVFGDWTGDVNHDSAAGGYSTDVGRNEGAVHGSGAGAVPNTAAASLPARGLLAIIGPLRNATSTGNGAAAVSAEPAPDTGQVLTAAAQTAPAATAAAAQSKNLTLMFVLSSLVMLVAGALLTIEKKLRG